MGVTHHYRYYLRTSPNGDNGCKNGMRAVEMRFKSRSNFFPTQMLKAIEMTSQTEPNGTHTLRMNLE